MDFNAAAFLVVLVLPDIFWPVGKCLSVIHTRRWPAIKDLPRPDSIWKSAGLKLKSANTSDSADPLSNSLAVCCRLRRERFFIFSFAIRGSDMELVSEALANWANSTKTLFVVKHPGDPP
jgi:hypothetical protein